MIIKNEEFNKLKSQGRVVNVVRSTQQTTPTTQQPQKTGFIQSMAQSTVSPFAKIASTAASAGRGVFNLGQAGMAKLQGNEMEYRKQLSQAGEGVNLNLGYFGKYEPVGAGETTGTQIKQAAGMGMEVAAWLLPLLKTGALTSVGKKTLLQLAKRGAVKGATAGGIYGTGSGLEETNTIAGAIKGGAIGVAGGAIIGFSTPFVMAGGRAVVRNVAGVFKGLGEKATGITITPPKSELKAFIDYNAYKPTLWQRVKSIWGKEGLQITKKPVSTAQTAVRLVAPGTERGMASNAKRTQGKLWSKVINPSLKKINDKVKMDDFMAELKKKIITENPEPYRQKQLLKAVDALYKSFPRGSNVSYLKLQDYKAGWQRFVPEKYYAGDVSASPINEIRGKASDLAREMIYGKISPETKTAYMDYGNLENLYQEGIKSFPRIDSNSITRQAWQTILDNVLTPVTTLFGKVVYRTGQGIEFIGDKGAKKIGDIIGPEFFTISLINSNPKTEKK